MSNENPTTGPEAEDRTVALLSYLTIVGWIIGLVMHGNKKTQLGACHLRQGLGLTLSFFALRIVEGLIPFYLYSFTLGTAVHQITWLLYLVLAILGLIAASNGQAKPLPVVGGYFERWFGGAIQ